MKRRALTKQLLAVGGRLALAASTQAQTITLDSIDVQCCSICSRWQPVGHR